MIAYEPVWAIKTGPADKRPAATPDVAGETHDFMKGLVGELYSEEILKKIRFLYGASVSAADDASAKNTRELLSQPSIDGFLVGTASVKMATFLPILELAESTLATGPVSYPSPAKTTPG